MDDIIETILGGIIFLAASGGIGYVLLCVSIGITVFVEKPIIKKSGITTNEKYIKAVNTITNAIFNMILIILLLITRVYFWYEGGREIVLAYFLGSELLWIPFLEAYAYKKISVMSFGKILGTCYVANVLSCIAGILIEALTLLLLNLIIFGRLFLGRIF